MAAVVPATEDAGDHLEQVIILSNPSFSIITGPLTSAPLTFTDVKKDDSLFWGLVCALQGVPSVPRLCPLDDSSYCVFPCHVTTRNICRLCRTPRGGRTVPWLRIHLGKKKEFTWKVGASWCGCGGQTRGLR